MAKKRKTVKKKVVKKRSVKRKTVAIPKTQEFKGPLLQDPVVRLSIWASLAVIFIAAIVILV